MIDNVRIENFKKMLQNKGYTLDFVVPKVPRTDLKTALANYLNLVPKNPEGPTLLLDAFSIATNLDDAELGSNIKSVNAIGLFRIHPSLETGLQTTFMETLARDSEAKVNLMSVPIIILSPDDIPTRDCDLSMVKEFLAEKSF